MLLLILCDYSIAQARSAPKDGRIKLCWPCACRAKTKSRTLAGTASLISLPRGSQDRFDKIPVPAHQLLAPLETAIAADPTFAAGHCLRAALAVISSERGALPMLEESIAAIEALGAKANQRERMHAAAARAWLAGDFHRSVKLYGDIVVDYPRDLLALQTAHGGDFLLGQSTMLRDRVAQVLPHWSTAVPGYGYVLGMHAFGLEETALYARAEGGADGVTAVEVGGSAVIVGRGEFVL